MNRTNQKNNFLLPLACVFLGCISSFVSAEPTKEIPYALKKTIKTSVIRGEIVFMNYCALCHGTMGDGNGRAAFMYNPPPANLRKSIVSDAYKEMIIRKGGKLLARSASMPSWEEELTEEQIHDVVNYLRVIVPKEEKK